MGIQAAPCAAFHAVYLHPGDFNLDGSIKLDPRTINQILSNNETGQKLCGWKTKHMKNA